MEYPYSHALKEGRANKRSNKDGRADYQPKKHAPGISTSHAQQGFRRRGRYAAYEKGTKGRYQLVVCDKSWDKLKENLKTITRKTTPMSMVVRIHKLKEIDRGWVNYFRMASIHGKLKEVDSWIRKRLRYCIWHDWKKPERRRKNLMRLGVDYAHAYAWSRTRMGGWAVAQSPILNTTITLDRLRKRGYEALLEYYFKVAPALNEPLYT